MSEAEVIEIVKKIAVDLGVSGKQDFGKLMPVVIKELKGKADGKIIKSIVENVLGAN